MSKLINYAEKADFMNISLDIDGQKYAFNLDKELRIAETKLNEEIKDQTRGYAFLAMLRNKVIQQQKKKQKQFERKKNSLFIEFKKTTAKVTEANQQALATPELRKIQDQVDNLTEIREILDIAVNAFVQRKDLLQTLSSNTRKTN